MKSFLSLMFFLLSVCLYSQVCEKGILKYEVDPIKKNKSIETKGTLLRFGVSVGYSMKFCLINKKIYLRLISEREDDFSYQQEVGFLFEGDSSVLLKFQRHPSVNYVANIRNYINDLELTTEEFMIFTRKKLVKVHFYATKSEIDISTGNSEKVIEKAICFHQNVDFSTDVINNTILVTNSANVTTANSTVLTTTCKFVQNEVDAIEGWRRLRLVDEVIGWAENEKFENYNGTEFKVEARGRLNVGLRSVDSTIFLRVNLTFHSSYCLNDKSILAIKFSDGEVIKIENIGGIDCGEYAKFDSRLTSQQIASLKTKEVVFIRLSYSDAYIDIKNIVQRKYFITHLDCLKANK